jgi:hypothetical protein
MHLMLILHKFLENEPIYIVILDSFRFNINFDKMHHTCQAEILRFEQ